VSLICNIIILFYWNQALNSYGSTVVTSLERFEVYMYILIGVVAVIDIIASIFRGLDYPYEILVFAQAFGLTVELACLVFVGYTAITIYRFRIFSHKLRNNSERTDNSGTLTSERKVMKMTRLVLIDTALIVVMVVFSGIALLPFSRSPYMEMAVWFVESTCVSLMGIFEVLILRKAKDPFPSADSGGQSSSSTKSTKYDATFSSNKRRSTSMKSSSNSSVNSNPKMRNNLHTKDSHSSAFTLNSNNSYSWEVGVRSVTLASSSRIATEDHSTINSNPTNNTTAIGNSDVQLADGGGCSSSDAMTE